MPSAELVSMRVKVNMVVTIAAALNFLSSLSSLIGQPSLGGLRLIFSVFFIYVLTQCDAIADSGRLGFSCHPETNDIHREQCFSRYSAEMSPLMRPYLFLLVTACILVCLWTTMILYSFRHLPKIRRETFSSKREHLCHEFWKKFLFHVGSEAVVLSVILGLFCFTQKIYFAETYNCTLRNAPVKFVLTCTDLYQSDKSFLNIVLIGVMALMLLFCIGTVYQAMCNEENFIKELLNLNTTENEADDGANHHRNTQFSGSSGFTSTGNPNEQQVAGVPDDIFQVIVNDFTIRKNFLRSLVYPVCSPRTYTVLIVHGLSGWIEDICSVMNSGELEERDKILDVLEQLPLSEALDQWITERAVMHRKRNTDIAQDSDESFPVSVSRRIVALVARWLRQIFVLITRGGVEEKAVMHRKRNTDIAQDRDESFPVSVSRRIVAIVARWLRQIFVLINRGGVEERDKILDVLKQLSVSKVLDQWITERAVIHRKRNTDIAQDRDEIFQVSVSRRIVAIVVKWVDEMFSVMISGELEERDKIVDLFDRLSELRDPWNTKRAVMHRKRNTDIAKDCDDSFPVSVSRRIVAIVARWLRQILWLINREGVEERDKILDMLEQLPLSEVLHQRITKGGYRL